MSHVHAHAHVHVHGHVHVHVGNLRSENGQPYDSPCDVFENMTQPTHYISPSRQPGNHDLHAPTSQSGSLYKVGNGS